MTSRVAKISAFTFYLFASLLIVVLQFSPFSAAEKEEQFVVGTQGYGAELIASDDASDLGSNIAALEASNAKLEARISALEKSQQRIAFIDPFRAIDSDEWYKAKAEEILKEVEEAKQELNDEFEPIRQKISANLKANTVGEVEWRKWQTTSLSTQLDFHERRREIEAELQEKGDAILAKVYKRLREATKSVCETDNFHVVVNRYGTEFGADASENLAYINTALRQNPVLYFNEDGAIDITERVAEVMAERAPPLDDE